MICLGGLHYDSLYALSLHSTFACLWVPFLCMLGGIREQAHVIKTQTSTTHDSN